MANITNNFGWSENLIILRLLEKNLTSQGVIPILTVDGHSHHDDLADLMGSLTIDVQNNAIDENESFREEQYTVTLALPMLDDTDEDGEQAYITLWEGNIMISVQVDEAPIDEDELAGVSYTTQGGY